MRVELLLVLCPTLADAVPHGDNSSSSAARRSSGCVFRPTSEGGFPPLAPDQQTSWGLTVAGSLVPAGGSLTQGSPVWDRILQLAGGRADARLVFFPTNSNSYPITDGGEAVYRSTMETAGWGDLPNTVVLRHTYDPEAANDPEFWSVIDSCTGAFFSGGRPQRSWLAYGGTATAAALERLLARGGVIGGSSAGALMMSNVMMRADSSGDNEIVLGDMQQGFAFGGMHNLAFDVHSLERNRAFEQVEVVNAYDRQVLGLSIDEDTAFSLVGDELQVVGSGYVSITDATLWQEVNYCGNFRLGAPNQSRPLIPARGFFFFLREGDR